MSGCKRRRDVQPPRLTGPWAMLVGRRPPGTEGTVTPSSASVLVCPAGRDGLAPYLAPSCPRAVGSAGRASCAGRGCVPTVSTLMESKSRSNIDGSSLDDTAGAARARALSTTPRPPPIPPAAAAPASAPSSSRAPRADCAAGVSGEGAWRAGTLGLVGPLAGREDGAGAAVAGRMVAAAAAGAGAFLAGLPAAVAGRGGRAVAAAAAGAGAAAVKERRDVSTARSAQRPPARTLGRADHFRTLEALRNHVCNSAAHR
jgi:hypothetical protein